MLGDRLLGGADFAEIPFQRYFQGHAAGAAALDVHAPEHLFLAGMKKPRSARLLSWWAHTDSNRGPKDYEFAPILESLNKANVANRRYRELSLWKMGAVAYSSETLPSLVLYL